MNRRAFFGMIAAGLAAAADPERLLWVPGRKLISIPAPTPVYGGVIMTPEVFARIVLANFRQENREPQFLRGLRSPLSGAF